MARTSKTAMAAALLAAIWAWAHMQAPALSAPPSPSTAAAPKRVTLKGDTISLRLAFAQMEAQTGQGFSLGSDDNTKYVTVNFADLPQWDALHQLLQQAGQKEAVNFQLVTGTAHDTYYGQWSSSGPYLTLATFVRQEADFRHEDDAQQKLWVELQALADPSLTIAYMDGTPTPTRASDENGNSLLIPDARPGPVNIPAVSRASHPARINLQPPAGQPPSHLIKVLEGTIAAGVVTRFQSLEFPLTESPPQDVAGVNVSVKITEQGANYRIETTFLRPDAMNPDGWRAWSRRYSAAQQRMVGADGKPIPVNYGGLSISAQNNVLRGQARKPTPPTAPSSDAKFIIDVPLEVQDVQIPYHFDDLPLP